jgi:capsule polysaccharide export protein KpsE/RkpR
MTPEEIQMEDDITSALRTGARPDSTLHDDGEQDGIDVVTIVRFLVLNKATFRITLASFIFAVILAFSLPVRYTSSASFVPPSLSTGNAMASALAGQLAAVGAGDLLGPTKNSGDIYAGILKSRSVASELVKHFDLTRLYKDKRESDAEKDLASDTSISIDTKSSIVTVSVTARTPQLAHDLANAYMDALRETNGRLALGQSSQRRLFFEEQLAKEKNELEDAEVDLKKTEEQSGLIAPTGQTEVQIRTIAETQAQIAARQVQLAALRQSSTEESPEVVRVRSEIADLQTQLSQLQRESGKGRFDTIPMSKVPELQLQYVRKVRELKYHEALFEILAKQYEAARLDEARDAPVLQILDMASYPDTKSSPKRMLIMLGGVMLGLIAGCGWVWIRNAHILTSAANPS